jgi:RNA 3'-terminal phosphate cyclase (ATP)
VLEIDGSQYSGSGTIVRQAVAFAALTETPIHIYNARMKRTKPGLRLQHAQAVEAVRQLVNGSTEGAVAGSREFIFCPGKRTGSQEFLWDIGSAGSTTALALAVLPVLAFSSLPVSIELRGGLFQDFAPSFYHLEHVLLPLLNRMGLEASAQMDRPGYVPTGGGIWRLSVTPTRSILEKLLLNTFDKVRKFGASRFRHGSKDNWSAIAWRNRQSALWNRLDIRRRLMWSMTTVPSRPELAWRSLLT